VFLNAIIFPFIIRIKKNSIYLIFFMFPIHKMKRKRNVGMLSFLSGMHGLQDNEVSLQAGYDVIVISPLGGASGDF